MTQGENYYCDCANLDFYGKHCEIRKTFKMIYISWYPILESDDGHHSAFFNENAESNQWLFSIQQLNKWGYIFDESDGFSLFWKCGNTLYF